MDSTVIIPNPSNSIISTELDEETVYIFKYLNYL